MKDSSLSTPPMKSFHAVPRFIAPRQSGETRTAALGERIRYRLSRPFASGGGANAILSELL